MNINKFSDFEPQTLQFVSIRDQHTIAVDRYGSPHDRRRSTHSRRLVLFELTIEMDLFWRETVDVGLSDEERNKTHECKKKITKTRKQLALSTKLQGPIIFCHVCVSGVSQNLFDWERS